MMNKHLYAIFLAAILTITVAMAGCAQPGPATPTVTPIANGSATAAIPAAAAGGPQSNASSTVVPAAPPENATPPEPAAGTAATPLPPAATVGPKDLKGVMDYSRFSWAEYQTTMTGSPDSRVKIENQVSYKGVTASRLRATMEMSTGNGKATIVYDKYFNPVTGETLGGHMSTTMNGQVAGEQDLSADEAGSPKNPLEAYGNTRLTPDGTGTIIVPAGPFEATKYTGTSTVAGTAEKATGSVWLTPNVPVPVKVCISGQSGVTNMELMGWG